MLAWGFSRRDFQGGLGVSVTYRVRKLVVGVNRMILCLLVLIQYHRDGWTAYP